MTRPEFEMVTIKEHLITITFPASYDWDDIRKELKPKVDIHHRVRDNEDKAKRDEIIARVRAEREAGQS